MRVRRGSVVEVKKKEMMVWSVEREKVSESERVTRDEKGVPPWSDCQLTSSYPSFPPLTYLGPVSSPARCHLSGKEVKKASNMTRRPS